MALLCVALLILLAPADAATQPSTVPTTASTVPSAAAPSTAPATSPTTTRAATTAPASRPVTRSSPKAVTPSVGVIFTKDTVVAPGDYLLASPDLNTPVLTIRGDDLTVDFKGVTLVGSPNPARPDAFTGLAVKVEGNNVTVRNLAARGYQVALLAHDAKNLTLENCDFSYNWRQRLLSNPWRENLSDWMSYHHNEQDEWLRYGAAVYLRNCDGFDVHGLTVVGGQNGLMLVESDNGVAHSNLISFNSGVGIGLYRSSGNRIMHNRLDFNVRGHSEGVYNRGQDSAGILVYEQSSNNIFAWNSATHSGDGFFLWAGQSTMDSGEGGSNDNLLFENDFSYAPTNGVEITFSRNQVVGNKIHGSWHGIWGGYSYDTLILGNDFAGNEDAINIEHGQNNSISHNRFAGDETAIRLHADGTPEEWGFGKARDTRSRGYTIARNDFRNVKTAIYARNTEEIRGFGNEFTDVETRFNIEGAEFQEIEAENPVQTRDERLAALRPEPIPGAKTPPPLVPHPSGRNAIRVTEWGPHDYRRPIVWPDLETDPSGLTLLLIPPGGTKIEEGNAAWRVESAGGVVEEEPVNGGARRLVLSPPETEVREIIVTFTFTPDQDLVDEFGQILPAGQPVAVTYRQFSAPIDWNVKFFAYDENTAPLTRPESFARLIAGEPVAETTIKRLDLRDSQPWAEGVPTDHFATVAEGSFSAPAGDYLLEVTSDDGVRVWLDHKMILDDWTPHSPRTELLPVKLDGEHKLRVQHFERTGYAALKVDLLKP